VRTTPDQNVARECTLLQGNYYGYPAGEVVTPFAAIKVSATNALHPHLAAKPARAEWARCQLAPHTASSHDAHEAGSAGQACLLGKLASLTYCVLMQDKVDGSSGSNLVTHHPGCRVSGWFAGGVDETIGADR